MPEIVKYLSIKEDALDCWAAVALCDAAGDDCNAMFLEEAICVLENALASNDLTRIVLTSTVFGRMKVRQSEAVNALARLWPGGSIAEQVMIVGAWAKLGRAASPALPLLEEIARNKAIDCHLGFEVGKALGAISTGGDRAERCLIEMLSNDSWHIASHTAAVLATSKKGMPKKAVDRLISSLDSENADVRHNSARILEMLGPRAARAVQALIQRIEEEEDMEVGNAVVTALGAIGTAALPELIEAIRRPKYRTVGAFQIALLAIGRAATAEVAHTLLTSDNATARQAGCWVLNSLGPEAKAAMPVLIELLDSDDREVMTDAVIALANMGREARGAVGHLIQGLFDEDNTLAEWSEIALVGIGPDAVEALKESRNCATAGQRVVLDRIMARIGIAGDTPRPEFGVEGIVDEDVLNLFAVVGQILLDRGPTSYGELSGLIETLKNEGKVPDRLPSSTRTIGKMIERVEGQVSNRVGAEVLLIDRRSKRKGGLTPAGQALHRRVVSFLEARERSNGPQ